MITGLGVKRERKRNDKNEKEEGAVEMGQWLAALAALAERGSRHSSLLLNGRSQRPVTLVPRDLMPTSGLQEDQPRTS